MASVDTWRLPRTGVERPKAGPGEWLLGDGRAAWLWLVVRLYIGHEWLTSGSNKVGDPRWMGDGSALLGFWQRAVAVPAPPARPPISYDWYRGFLQALIDGQAHGWFAKLIVLGELAVGVALILGALVGVAAFFGALMNMNYMLAGSASTNPVLLLGAIGLMAAWRVAGHLGLDRLLLTRLRAWRPGGPAAMTAVEGSSSPTAPLGAGLSAVRPES